LLSLGSHNANLTGSAITFARAAVLTRVDGTVKRFADIQTTTTFSSNAFTAVAGIAFASMPFQANSGATRADIEIAATDDGSPLIDKSEVQDGLYDSAQFIFYLCDPATPANGLGALFAGTVGEVKITDRGHVVFECVGILGKSKTIIQEHRTPVCRNWLYDENCRVVKASYTDTATVVSASGFDVVISALSRADDYFNLGFMELTSGPSKGRVYEIRDWVDATNTVTLYLPPDAALVAGNSLSIHPGCDYTPGANGCGKFVDPATGSAPNILNYRGEPHVPGQDARAINYTEWGA
jgi:uncharacterized phage protein (TIGR02218 family)